MNHYKAFGLIISSEIAFNELITCDNQSSDLLISEGEVPLELNHMNINTPMFKVGEKQFWLVVDGIGKFYVENGSLIIVEAAPGVSLEDIKLYILGSCIGAILYQRKILPLHGSAINMKGYGLILTGDAGVGKSTITSAICKRGYHMLTDDVAAIRIEEYSRAMIYPSYPYQKLWGDAIERLNINNEKKSLNRRDVNNQSKYSVAGDNQFDDNPIPVSVIVEIIPVEEEQLSWEKINGVTKLEIVLKNTYRRIIAEGMGLNKWHFNQCMQIAATTVIYRLNRPKNKYMEEEIANLILGKMI